MCNRQAVWLIWKKKSILVWRLFYIQEWKSAKGSSTSLKLLLSWKKALKEPHCTRFHIKRSQKVKFKLLDLFYLLILLEISKLWTVLLFLCLVNPGEEANAFSKCCVFRQSNDSGSHWVENTIFSTLFTAPIETSQKPPKKKNISTDHQTAVAAGCCSTPDEWDWNKQLWKIVHHWQKMITGPQHRGEPSCNRRRAPPEARNSSEQLPSLTADEVLMSYIGVTFPSGPPDCNVAITRQTTLCVLSPSHTFN